eukprot:scaffold4613_cov129-Isochrysis_galbana.AAC.3
MSSGRPAAVRTHTRGASVLLSCSSIAAHQHTTYVHTSHAHARPGDDASAEQHTHSTQQHTYHTYYHANAATRGDSPAQRERNHLISSS